MPREDPVDLVELLPAETSFIARSMVGAAACASASLEKDWKPSSSSPALDSPSSAASSEEEDEVMSRLERELIFVRALGKGPAFGWGDGRRLQSAVEGTALLRFRRAVGVIKLICRD